MSNYKDSKFYLNFDEIRQIIQAQAKLESFVLDDIETKNLMIWFLKNNYLYNHDEMQYDTNQLKLLVDNQEKYVVTKNLLETWSFMLLNYDKPIDLDYILDLHFLLGNNVVYNPGEFRTLPVYITGTKYEPPNEIDDNHITKLEFLLLEKDYIKTSLYIMKTQFFNDGNKRTGYFVLNSYLLKENKMLFLKKENIRDYIKSIIHYYENEDDSLFRIFVKDNTIELKNNKEKEILKKIG